MTGALAAAPEDPGGIDVQLRGVVHVYPSPDGDVAALRGVDLDVDAGETVALLGPSGAGKSTVLGLLAGNFTASAGQVVVGGEDLGRLSGARLARLRALEVSLVVQDADRNLLPYATAAENVWFAQQGARGHGARPTLEPVDLLDRFGLADVAGSPVGRLAAGQRQCVAVATGVASQPRLLLVDEPTSRLEPAARARVVDLLLAVGEQLGTTVVVVTHDPEVARRLGRTVTISAGRVGAEGRSGADHVLVGRDGLLQLPEDVLDLLPPGSLVEVRRVGPAVEVRRIDAEAGGDGHDVRDRRARGHDARGHDAGPPGGRRRPGGDEEET